MTKTIRNLKELRTVAEEFLGVLSKNTPKGQGVVVGLTGDLGAGKTAFTKCVAEALGVGDVVTSPTFVLEKRYDIKQEHSKKNRFSKLIHIDAYRLNSGNEMSALDWETTLADEQNLILIEWPEQIKEALPSNMVNLTFEYVDEGVRNVSGDYIQ